MRKIFVFLLFFSFLFALDADEISFEGNESRIVLKEGRENVELTGGAKVTCRNLVISADNINLSGDNWRYVSVDGNVLVLDEERELEIRTSMLWYDRINELLLIGTYFELDDRKNEMNASATSLEYDMKNENLVLSGRVRLSKMNETDLVSTRAESIRYDRSSDVMELLGSANVLWQGDRYSAEVIRLDLANDSIELDTRIKGTING